MTRSISRRGLRVHANNNTNALELEGLGLVVVHLPFQVLYFHGMLSDSRCGIGTM